MSNTKKPDDSLGKVQESYDAQQQSPEIQAADQTREQVATAREPHSVNCTYTRMDFPENPRWGMDSKAVLVGGTDPQYRKNVPISNHARALDALRQSKAPMDIQLAAAACAKAISLAIDPGFVEVLTGVEFDPSDNTMVLHFNNKTIQLSETDIMQYNIPYLAGYDENAEVPVAEKAQEGLWHMATHPKNDHSRLKLYRYYVDPGTSLIAELKPTTQIGIVQEALVEGRQATTLAQFPMNELDLTDNERDLIDQGDAGIRAVFSARAKGNKIEKFSADALRELLKEHTARKAS